MNFKILFLLIIIAVLFSCSKPDPVETQEWHEVGASGQPQFQNNWTNSGSVKCSFMEDCDKFISLKGTVSTTSPVPSVIFYLPEGHCPDEDLSFQSGNVVIRAFVAGTGSAVESKITPVTLDGITFLDEK